MLRLVLSCLFLCLASPALADSIRVGTTGDYQPVTWWNTETDRFEGQDIDLVKAFAHAKGHELIFVRTSWPTLMDDLTAGNFTVAVGGISHTDARARVALVSNTIRTDGKVALVRCGEEARFDSMKKINQPHVRVVENPGGTNEKFARKHITIAGLRVVDDNHAPFTALLEGAADVMFTDGIEALYKQSVGAGLCAVNPAAPYTKISKVFLFSKDRPHLRDSFNEWLENHAGG
ncbi:transporter substrate-binding domain-containing protein [Kordiimonas sp.]|uniref:transporter substrate-binding domain-containing protein n=1 Tax=Kordiimonas sp. TaxID=1970157 RepID=UPI003A8FC36C